MGMGQIRESVKVAHQDSFHRVTWSPVLPGSSEQQLRTLVRGTAPGDVEQALGLSFVMGYA